MGLPKIFNLDPAPRVPAPVAPQPAAGGLTFTGMQAATQSPEQRLVAEVDKQAGAYMELVAERTNIGTEQGSMLAAFKASNPRYAQLSARYLEILDQLDALKEAMVEKVRKLKKGVKVHGIDITFEDPKKTTYNADMLRQLMPTSVNIPGLFRLEINETVFDGAAAAGLIPPEVVTQVKTSESYTKAGRVEFKPPKG